MPSLNYKTTKGNNPHDFQTGEATNPESCSTLKRSFSSCKKVKSRLTGSGISLLCFIKSFKEFMCPTD